jgi:hypothetical protein
MELIKEFISNYGVEILNTILVAVVTFLGTQIKRIYENFVNDKTKKQVVEDTVKYVEQIYTDIKGEEKLNKAIESATQILNEKGISITEIELRVMIESVCNSFKEGVK